MGENGTPRGPHGSQGLLPKSPQAYESREEQEGQPSAMVGARVGPPSDGQVT